MCVSLLELLGKEVIELPRISGFLIWGVGEKKKPNHHPVEEKAVFFFLLIRIFLCTQVIQCKSTRFLVCTRAVLSKPHARGLPRESRHICSRHCMSACSQPARKLSLNCQTLSWNCSMRIGHLSESYILACCPQGTLSRSQWAQENKWSVFEKRKSFSIQKC